VIYKKSKLFKPEIKEVKYFEGESEDKNKPSEKTSSYDKCEVILKEAADKGALDFFRNWIIKRDPENSQQDN
jgi:hypothetical protein